MKLTDKKGVHYKAAARVEQLTEKLGAIEHEAPVLLAKICDGYCMYPQVLQDQDAVDEKCEGCPMKELMEMIE